ncbi:MAG: hypothetical protein K6A32_03390 [Bacteroidales bacterium]|nr:hypothetical protein [Bacteroidales bacterium]
MKKIYQKPDIEVIKMIADGKLCGVSGATDPKAINNEGEESLDVKQHFYSNNSFDWEDW